MPESDFPPGAFLSLKIIFSAWKYAEMFSLNLGPLYDLRIALVRHPISCCMLGDDVRYHVAMTTSKCINCKLCFILD